MGDLRDPNEAERLAFEEPDEYLRRRDFLGRIAVLGGLGAGMGLLLDPNTLIGQAAAAQRRVPLPSPRNMPIDTFVVLMMENRSFDHYLGWLPGADGRQAGLTFTDASGAQHPTHRLTPDFQGCAFLDPDHSWEGGRTELDGGKMDGFLKAQSDVFSIGYYTEPDLPFIPSAARAFTAYDRFFCSLLSSTYPNREYMHAAQSYGMTDNTLPKTGFPDTTIFNALSKKGVSNRYFFTDLPVAALWGAPGVARAGHVQEYYQRCKDGQAARALLRGSCVRGRGQRHLGRRAPARRRAHRPGVHGRRGARLHGVAAVEDAARCSSSTTSGAASSTTCARRGCRTIARARTSRRTSGRWASASPRWRSRPGSGAGTWTTRSTASSRS